MADVVSSAPCPWMKVLPKVKVKLATPCATHFALPPPPCLPAHTHTLTRTYFLATLSLLSLALSHFLRRLAFLVYKFLWPKNACLMAGIVHVCECVCVGAALSTWGWGYPWSYPSSSYPTSDRAPFIMLQKYSHFFGWFLGICCLLQMPF